MGPGARELGLPRRVLGRFAVGVGARLGLGRGALRFALLCDEPRGLGRDTLEPAGS